MHLFALASLLAAPTAAAPDSLTPTEPATPVRLIAPDTGDAAAAAPAGSRAQAKGGAGVAPQLFGA